jgi:hypothetical protein
MAQVLKSLTAQVHPATAQVPSCNGRHKSTSPQRHKPILQRHESPLAMAPFCNGTSPLLQWQVNASDQQHPSVSEGAFDLDQVKFILLTTLLPSSKSVLQQPLFTVYQTIRIFELQLTTVQV